MLRGSDLTRLMVTLGVALIFYELANRFDNITGGADGLQGVVMTPLLGRFAFGLSGHVAYAYSLAVLFVLFLIARTPDALAVRLFAAGHPRQPHARDRDRHPGEPAACGDLHARRGLCRRGGRAARADDRASCRSTRSTSTARPT